MFYIIKYFVFVGFLYLLSKAFKDFDLDIKGMWGVAGILLLLDFTLGNILSAIAYIPNFLTLGLFSFISVWVINIIVLFVTDKISDMLEIKSGLTLIISGALLSVARTVVNRIDKIF